MFVKIAAISTTARETENTPKSAGWSSLAKTTSDKNEMRDVLPPSSALQRMDFAAVCRRATSGSSLSPRTVPARKRCLSVLLERDSDQRPTFHRVPGRCSVIFFSHLAWNERRICAFTPMSWPTAELAGFGLRRVSTLAGVVCPGGIVRISVVITNYNYGDCVGAAIDSALAIAWPEKEVIFVDDGSTDHSPAVISGYGDRIKAVFKANGGQNS